MNYLHIIIMLFVCILQSITSNHFYNRYRYRNNNYIRYNKYNNITNHNNYIKDIHGYMKLY